MEALWKQPEACFSMVGGAVCDSHAGIMLEEFAMGRRQPQRVKEDLETVSSQIANLTGRRERGDLDT